MMLVTIGELGLADDLTLDDLSPDGKMKVLVLLLRKNQLSDEFVRTLTQQAQAVKASADAGQAAFDEIARPIDRPRTKPPKR